MGHFRAFRFALPNGFHTGKQLILVAVDLLRHRIGGRKLSVQIIYPDFLAVVDILDFHIALVAVDHSLPVRLGQHIAVKHRHPSVVKGQRDAVHPVDAFGGHYRRGGHLLHLSVKYHQSKVDGINSQIQQRAARQRRLLQPLYMGQHITQIGGK